MHDLAIHPELQGFGIGARLIKKVVTQVSSGPCAAHTQRHAQALQLLHAEQRACRCCTMNLICKMQRCSKPPFQHPARPPSWHPPTPTIPTYCGNATTTPPTPLTPTLTPYHHQHHQHNHHPLPPACRAAGGVIQVNASDIYDVGLVTPQELQPFFQGCSFDLDREESVPMVLRGLSGGGHAESDRVARSSTLKQLLQEI